MDSIELLIRINNRAIPEPNSGCLFWEGPLFASGYGVFHMNGINHRVHRFKYRLLHPNFDEDLEVRHECDIRCCIADNHLRAGTHQQNMDDATQRNRRPRGIATLSNVLTEDQVYEIRRRGKHESFVALGEEFGVSNTTARLIYNRAKWASLPEKL